MLESIEIKNFRSIRSAKFSLSPTGLTVFIGANGSGKSNIVKCLTFLADVAGAGLESAVRSQRGFEGILPKYIPSKYIRKGAEETRLTYTARVQPPANYPESAPPLRVQHVLAFAPHPQRLAQVLEEKLTFEQPLLVAACLKGTSAPVNFQPELTSTLTITKQGAGNLQVSASPPVEGPNLDGYLRWFGLEFLKDTLSDSPAADEIRLRLPFILTSIPSEERSRSLGREWSSFLEPEAYRLTTFSPEARVFRDFVSSIRNYDFQLTNLRNYQESAATDELQDDGKGLPAAVRGLVAKSTAWRRLQDTLRELAPHVTSTSVKSLHTGQEFVEFIERQSGRPVESWECSDGTLRALAILVAAETCPSNRMLLIEEPEQGLHPWAVRTVIKHLRQTITERHVQFVLTTHSQQVLESVSPSEVIVVAREPEVGTTFATIAEVAPNATLGPGDLGRLWVKGLLGGVPSSED